VQQGTENRLSAKESGRVGGYARAERYGHEVLSDWASSGGFAILGKYGKQYFSDLRKRRKHYPKRYVDQTDEPAVTTPPAVVSARANGQRGGFARAKRYSKQHIVEWGRRGGLAVRKLYGRDYFRKIRKLRKRYRKGYLTKTTKQRIQRELDEAARDGLITSFPLFK
jgi:hypothetical protein